MTELAGTGAQEPQGDEVEGALLAFGDGWDEDAGPQPADEASKGLVIAFGKTLKMVREREGVDRPTLGRAIGYSAATVASYEQGRRIASGRTIDKADKFLNAGGLLSVWKEQMEQAQYPTFFQGMASLEKQAVELLSYNMYVFTGLLQTEEYMRALLAMRRPILDPDLIEQRVAARLARQVIFDRQPMPMLSFVIDESVLRRPYGGKDVLRGQLEHLLLLGRKPNVELQIMPQDREENAGVDGPFTIVIRKDGKRFVYTETQGTSALQTNAERTTLFATRYGIIRSQALPPRESMKTIEGVLGSL
ncbi:helix-turn-helix transcriptional regulator [Streptomyces roseirectus]|uniref:Helix-turn-helix transcriptional regulator n=1 Tax=Streptomyces roseirectus TaxID=2768066 RepID=A0A7H0ICS5_9ACTN|nr:helix-turn-helix transcriptional regulator [Streptomyces roseirectus]QNP70591.1 helix-turn-helix transcriptional regulator [Streptomyces roseirectus]